MNPSIFNFLSNPATDIDMACSIDQTEGATANIAVLDLSDSISTAPSATNTLMSSSYAPPPSTAPTVISLPATYAKDTRSTHPPSHRRGDGLPRKRAKIDDSPEFTLDSVDYWLRFDDEEIENNPNDDLDGGCCRGSGRTTNICPQRQQSIPAQTSAVSAAPSLFSAAQPYCEADLVEENVWDRALSDENDNFGAMNLAEEMANLNSAPPPAELPPREGLYSTPLSWERPQPGIRTGPVFPAGPTILSDAERRRLLDIALNTGRPSSSFVSGLDLGFSSGFGPWASVPTMGSSGRQTRATDSSPEQSPATLDRHDFGAHSDADGSSPEAVSPPPRSKLHRVVVEKIKEKTKSSDRSGHNDIERKYRTNLKDRIAELRDAVPALRSMGDDGAEDEVLKAAKVSKGTILMKAAEYIRYLERRNKAIKKEHQELETRLQAFEQLMAAAAKQSFLMQNHGVALFDPHGFT